MEDKNKFFDNLSQNPKILIFSDLHFYKHRGSCLFISIVINLLKRILEIVDQFNIKTIFFIGDWFHEKYRVGTQELVITSRFLNALKKKNVNILFIPGNHDILMIKKNEYNIVETFNILDNVFVVHDYFSVVQKDKCLHFFSYFSSLEDIIKQLEANKDKKNYFFGHIELKEINIGSAILQSNSSITVDFLHTNFVRSFIGHYHGHQFIKNNVCVVGSTHQQNFGEAGNKNVFLIFNLETNQSEIIPNDFSPQFKKIYLKDLNIDGEKLDIEQILKQIPYTNCFLRIIVNKNIDSDFLIQLKEKLSQNNHLVEIVLDSENLNNDDVQNNLNADLTQTLSLIDLTNSANIKSFFKTYLEAYPKFPDGVNKERLINLIDEIVF